MTDSLAIELRGIDKRFGDVHANKYIDLKVKKGTIHGIVGENGAGKSTLMSIIYGFYQADAGDILIDGQVVHIKGSQDAINAGIGMVHQHFMLVDNFSVLENVMLGTEGGMMLRQGMGAARTELQRLANDYGLDIDPDAIVEELPVGLQQRVEILKALYRGAKVLILDEPTGVLTPQETEHLFKILASLKERGTTVILITHKLREIMAATDHVSVMRRGEMVAHVDTPNTNREELAELMVGRKVRFKVEREAHEPGKALLSVKDVVVREGGVDRLKNISFEVHEGEILGVAGVSGNGQSELLEALSGIRPINGGVIELNGHQITAEYHMDPYQVRGIGVGHVPEDRHKMGLINKFDAQEAFILGYHRKAEYNHMFLQNKAAILKDCQEKMDTWDVRPADPNLKTANFSGGNQQKLVIAREVEQDPDVLLVGQPTRGVDIGAIEFIHKRIVEMRNAGKAVLLVSVELDEIMSLADRIIVMFDGNIVGEISSDQADEKTLGLMMANCIPDHLQQAGGNA
ncbi:ABC transporter ATP-binding protein [Gynuella sp.]|uniref:ABC transporter ATP-binding protein n=1 Tax=Gynuella sp. TaxID=2969146 RepID=UPI003D129ED9